MITILPAIDIMDGQCVRLTEGDFSTRKTYYRNPLDAALLFEDSGLKNLHLVDLDNAREGTIASLEVLESISSKTSLHIDYGGGVKTRNDVQAVLNAGAMQVNCGSIAAKNPEIFVEWINEFGESIILSADAKDDKISTAGWQDDSDLNLDDFVAHFEKEGLSYVTTTDIRKDGRLAGPAIALYERLRSKFPGLNICASGGVTRMSDVEELQELGVDRVIIGKAIYEGVITLGDISKFLENA